MADLQGEPPRLAVVGPLLGGNPGWVTSQGEILAGRLEDRGWVVHTVSSLPGRLARVLDTAAALVRWRNGVDVVLCMVFSGRAFAMADLTSALARRLRLPLVFWLHGGDLPAFARRHPRWVRRVLRRSARLVAPSAYLGECLASGGPDAVVLRNILDVDRYRCPRESTLRPRLFWMRTFHELYHPEMALRCLSLILPSRPDAELTMAGQDRGLEASIRALAEELGIAGRVRFVGFLDEDRKIEEMRRHDIFLNTNRVDNVPVSVLEAVAAGMCVVATDVGGIPFLLRHEESALLVPDGDAAAMAAAVERLLNDPALAPRLRAGGSALAGECDAERVLPQWEELLRGVVAGAVECR